MPSRKVFFAGEGANELGEWHREPQWRSFSGGRMRGGEPVPGVLSTLLRKVSAEGWTTTNAIKWKDIPSLVPGRRDVEGHRVRALFRLARESECDTVVFARDRDGAANVDRERQIADAIAEEVGKGPLALGVVGGIAVEKIEAWVLALDGRSRSEDTAHPETVMTRELRVPVKDTAAMVAIAERADLDRVPEDARSLCAWIAAARRVFCSDDAG